MWHVTGLLEELRADLAQSVRLSPRRDAALSHLDATIAAVVQGASALASE
jgi:hypothetical protein